MKKYIISILLLIAFGGFSMTPSSHNDGKEFRLAYAYPENGHFYKIKLEASAAYLEERDDRWIVWTYCVLLPPEWADEFRHARIEPLEVYTTWQPWYYCYIVVSKEDVYAIKIAL